MSPVQAIHYAPDRRLSNSVFRGQPPLADTTRRVALTDLQHVGGREYRAAVALAPRPRLGVKPCTVTVAAGQPFRPQSCAVPITAGQPLGVRSRVMIVAAWPSLGVLPRRVCIATWRDLPPLGVSVGVVVRDGAEPQVGWVATRRIVTVMADGQPGRYRTVDKHPRDAMGAALPSLQPKGAVAAAIQTRRPRPTRVFAARPVNLGPEPLSRGIIYIKHRKLHSGGPVGLAGPRPAFVLPTIIAGAAALVGVSA